jgi:HD-like signal output (HDOD) protein
MLYQTDTATSEYQFDLLPFPSTAARLVSALGDESTDVRDVIKLIECEPKVSSRVLQMSNSPLYGATRSIATIGHAVVILGFKSVSNLALTAAAEGIFSQGGVECGPVRKQTYFQSLAIGTVARLLAQQVDEASPDEAFLAGVMHDIGKLVLLDAAGRDYVRVITGDEMGNDELRNHELGNHELGNTVQQERQLFGTSHPELGQSCGHQWGLPPSIITAIGNHHKEIADVSDSTSIALIAANYAARKWEIGFENGDALTACGELDEYVDSLGDPDLQGKAIDQFVAICDICAA